MNYFERAADTQLKARLNAFGAVLIEGPKWCGKTTTAEQVAKSVLKMQSPEKRANYLVTAAENPSLLLNGDTPRLIDEWQDAPQLWDAIRTTVDERAAEGQFILTGSNTVDKSQIHHSGNGRITRMRMLPMSLWESKDSNGTVCLKQLFEHPTMEIDGATSSVGIEELIYLACRGGWPATIRLKDDASKLLVAKNYFQTVCSEDIQRVDNVRRDEKLTRCLLRSYARNISTLAKKSAILQDITESENITCSADTLASYISALERLFVIQDIDAWNPNIRSKTVIRSGSKRCFCDPSIVVAALGLTPEVLQMELKTFGFIFEQMCIRDLRAYTSDIDTHVSFYRDRLGLEADIVLHLGDGRYALIECKLGSRELDEGAAHLCELHRLIKQHNETAVQTPLREPDLKIILTGGEYAYRRKDGVYVIPLACLKP